MYNNKTLDNYRKSFDSSRPYKINKIKYMYLAYKFDKFTGSVTDYVFLWYPVIFLQKIYIDTQHSIILVNTTIRNYYNITIIYITTIKIELNHAMYIPLFSMY